VKFNKVIFIISFLSVIMTLLLSCITTRWNYIEPESIPSSRAYTAMVYDSESDKTILFSGQEGLTGGPFPQDTWTFDINTMSWNNMNSNNMPRSRSGHAMAYDSESDRIVLFSGWVATNDTLIDDLNTNIWTEMNPVNNPSNRFGHRMVYDVESDRVILFGGWMNFEDTWSYDYNTNTWENLNPSVHPSARAYHTMTYDAESDRVILFGGGEPGSLPSYKKIFNKTWAYDYNSNTWTNMNPENPPSSRVYADMTMMLNLIQSFYLEVVLVLKCMWSNGE
jgi:hypothetical protein